MEYISAEEFLKQPKEVQRVFLDWWKPSEGDLFVIDRNNVDCKECVLHVTDDYIKGINTRYIPNECIPLFTEGQLRQFIEDNINDTFDIYERRLSGYWFKCIDSDFNIIKQFETNEHDLLKAYWQIALELAKEKVKA